MNIEEALAANTAALIENTAAHAKLAEVAMAAAGGKSAAGGKVTEKPKDEEEEEQTETAAEKKKRLAAEKKAAAAAAAAAKEKEQAEPPELVAEMTAAALHKIAAAFMSDDLDEAERDENKANFVGGLNHLGAKKFSELADDSERARLAGYIGYWSAGLDVDFEAIDTLIEELGDADPMG